MNRILKMPFFCITICVLLFGVSYVDTFNWMLGRYLSPDSYYSHGFLVPFISGYLAWLRWEEFDKLQSRISWSGFVLVIIAALSHLFGTVAYIFSVSGFSIWLLLVGSCLFIYGWEKTKLLWFPLFFLLFMLPAPLALINAVSFPLKIFVAHYGVQIVALLSVPICREGFNIIIPQGTLLVGNPCSGLRSIIAFLAIGSLAAYFSSLSARRKLFLFLLTVPIALLANLIRVPILILLSYKYGLSAAAPSTFVHTASGVFVFLLGVTLLYIAMYLLRGTRER